MEATPTELESFTASAESVVAYLRAHSCLTDWSVSRIDAVEQVHLHVSGDGFLQVGDRVPWEITFCRQMLAGASQIVVDSQLDPPYAALPAAADVRSYAGFPILEDDGSVFGTLCGLGADPMRSADEVDAELLGLLSALLSSQLRLVRAAASLPSSAVLAEAAANTDALTGLLSRRGWEIVTTDADARVAGLGEYGGVVMIDLDGLKSVNDGEGHHAGDRLLRTAGAALREASRSVDSVARLGGDEFAVYVEGVPVADLDPIARRYTEALDAAGVAGSVGAAAVIPTAGPGCVARALAEADALMYAAKAARKANPSGPRQPDSARLSPRI